MANKLHKEIYNLISQKDKILIMPSSPPDGDSLGSALALYLVLKKMGKEVTVVCAEPIPETYKFLPTSNVIRDKFAASSDFIVTLDCSRAEIADIKTKIENDKVNIIITPKEGNLTEKGVSFSYGATNYELIIVVDAGDLQQLGRFYEDNTDLFTRIPVINIDHHTSNSQYGKLNLLDIMAPSTTEVILHMLEDFPKSRDLIDEDVATLLLAGIITDTGSFQNANTTPRAFAGASHLLGYGARQQEIIQYVYKTKNLSTLKLWGRVLSKIKTDDKYKMVWSTITQKDLEETGSHQDETGDIIDELMTNAPGAEVIMLIKEREKGLVSVSVRTTHAGVDASELAEIFGGGGHVQAAGFRVKCADVEEAEKKIITAVKEFQAKRLFIPQDGSTQDLLSNETLAQMKNEPMLSPSTPEEVGEPVVQPETQTEAPANLSFHTNTETMPKDLTPSVPEIKPEPVLANTMTEPASPAEASGSHEELKEMTKKFFQPENAQFLMPGEMASQANMGNASSNLATQTEEKKQVNDEEPALFDLNPSQDQPPRFELPGEGQK